MEILVSYLCAKVTGIGLRELPIEIFLTTLLLAESLWRTEKPQTKPLSNNKNTPNQQKKGAKELVSSLPLPSILLVTRGSINICALQ